MAKGAKGRRRRVSINQASAARFAAVGRSVAAGRHAAVSRAARLAAFGLFSAIAGGAIGLTGCKTPDNEPFDPRAIQHDLRAHAEASEPEMRQFPTAFEKTPSTQRSRFTTPVNSAAPMGAPVRPTTVPSGGLSGAPAPIVRLGLREVIQRTVANSAEVRVAGYDPAINAQKVIQEQAKFDPRFFTNISAERQSNQSQGLQAVNHGPIGQTSAIIFNQRANIYQIQSGIRQVFPSGAEARLSYQISDNDQDPPFDQRFINPYWENILKLEVTQPLLRGFGSDVNSARITIAQNDERISILDFRKSLEDTLSEIEKDYWQLVEAEREVEITQELLQRTAETVTHLRERFEQGMDASAIPVSQAESSAKAREASLIAAQARVRDLSSDLKRRMNDPEFPVSSATILLTSDAPLSEPVHFEIKEQIASALENRLELAQQSHRIASSENALNVARNGLKPKLDLVFTGGVQGLDGTSGNAFDNQSDFNHISYSFGLQFEYPFGNREARAAFRQAQLQRMQAIDQYRNLIGQVSLDVELSWNDVYSQWRQAVARQQSRLAAQTQLTRIQEQEDAGLRLDPPFVQVKLQAQEELATAQREEANAIASYNIAIQKLERAKGTLLRYNNVILEQNPEMPRMLKGYGPIR